MKKRSLKVSVIAIALLGVGLGGCASMEAAIPDTGTKLACGAAGGLAMHALTGGASSAWHVVSTIAGVGVGSALCDKLGK